MTLTVSSPSDIGAFSSVSSISDQDEVVGSGNGGTTGFVWQNGQTATLPVVENDQSGVATGVNDQGQIVGYSSAGGVYHSISWQNGQAAQLPGLGASTRDYAINDQGIIVGSAADSNGLAVATEIVNGAVIQLGILPGGYLDNTSLADGRAFAINNGGQIVGLSMTSSGVAHAVIWQDGTVTDLGAIAGGGLSLAYGINQRGTDIVGYAVDANGIDQAVVWQNGTMTILPDHQSNGHSIAFGVNDAGIIVGRSDVYTGSGWQEDAVLWQNGILVDLNSFLPTNSGWVLNVAQSINDNGEIAGIGTYDGVTAGFVLSIGDSSGPMVTAAAALQTFKAAPHSAALSVLDTAADIQANLDGLQGVASVGKLLQIQVSDSAALGVTAGQLTTDANALADISGNYSLHVTGETINDAYGALSAPHVMAVGIADTAFWVGASLDQLQSWAAAGQLTGITVTDSQDPLLSVTAQQVAGDALALKAIQGSYQLTISDATVAQALAFSAGYTVSSVQITDSIDAAVAGASQLQTIAGGYSLDLSGSAADLAANFDALASLQRSSFTQVTVTDSDFPTVSITAAQAQGASSLLFGLQGKFILSIDASQLTGGTIDGAPAVATIVAFPNAVSDYVLSTWGGSDLSVENTAAGGSDLLVQVTAVQFADGTDFVVQAPSATGVTSGNVAELYAAVLARTPDVAGLAYYDSLIQSGSGPSMLQLAEYFLTSPEYVNNPAHAYAQSAAGDAQFITDTYQNLLHRTPDSGAVPFYQNVINQFTAGLTPGTAAYATAQMQGHAQVLVYFSASQEFLNDVQITAQHPADAQHWLYVL